MKPRALILSAVIATLVLGTSQAATAKNRAASAGDPVSMVVTVVGGDHGAPKVYREDVMVEQDGVRVPVLEWVPLQGDRAGMDLYVLIDDAWDGSSPSFPKDELRRFISAQPTTT